MALGGVLAGIAAKQTSQSVAATVGIHDNFFNADGPGSTNATIGFATFSSTLYQYGVNVGGTLAGVVGGSASGYGVSGSATGTGVGVYATAVSGTAVSGTSSSGVGLLGTASGANKPGVKGINTDAGANSVGVQGYTGGSGIGVLGGTKGGSPVFNGTGVQGLADNGYGVEGKAGAGRGVNAVSDSGYGVYATANGTYPAIRGENDSNGDGIQGYAGGAHAGVVGWGGFNGGGTGVTGVGAYSNVTATADGVRGYGTGTGTGVAGWGGQNGGAGVYGFGSNQDQTVDGDGVKGYGAKGFSGVVGFGGSSGGAGVFAVGGAKGSASGTGAGVTGLAFGAPNPGAGLLAGVYGGGGTNMGVYGTSSGGPGVFGTTTAAQNAGLAGLVSTPGTAAFAGTRTVPNAFAGFFTGDVFVNGNFTVLDPTKKHGAIAHPDGCYRSCTAWSHRRVGWRTSARGNWWAGRRTSRSIPTSPRWSRPRTTTSSSPPKGDRDALTRDSGRRGSGCRRLQAGTADMATFRYRVVAKPKSENKATRLAKFTIPTIKVPQVAWRAPPPGRGAVQGAGCPAAGAATRPPAAPTASTPVAAPQGTPATPATVQPVPPPRSG